MQTPQDSGITLVLGSGGARGLVHIGVLLALKELKIPVRAVVGCSMGAQLGAFYCAGWSPEQMGQDVARMGKRHTLSAFVPKPWGGGLVWNRGVRYFLRKYLNDRDIESFDIPFAAVACDLQSGAEVVIDKGPAWSAVRASIAIPGVLAPHKHQGQPMLADGALVNPLPVSVARARYPWPVVAVQAQIAPRERFDQSRRVYGKLGWMTAAKMANEIMHWELAQWQLQRHAPDLLIEPDLHELACFGYHQGHKAGWLGYIATRSHGDEITQLLNRRRVR